MFIYNAHMCHYPLAHWRMTHAGHVEEWPATGEYQLEGREGVQGGSETSNVVRVWDRGTDEKTGGGDGGGRVEDVTIFIRMSDKNGQDQEWVHQRNGTGGTV